MAKKVGKWDTEKDRRAEKLFAYLKKAFPRLWCEEMYTQVFELISFHRFFEAGLFIDQK